MGISEKRFQGEFFFLFFQAIEESVYFPEQP